MGWINELIHYVDNMGWGQAVYDAAYPVNIAVMFVFFLAYRGKYSLPWWKGLIVWAVTVLGIPRLNVFLAWALHGFQSDASANILYAFAYFPLLCLLLAKLLKVKAGAMLDYMAPSILIWHIIGQSVCPFLGCCAGIPCSWGIWNPFLETMVFPVQWLISLTAFLVLLFILRYAKRRQYDGSGRVYPLMLIMLGGIRFFEEFLKDSSKVFIGLSELALHALFMLLVGTAWYLTLEEIRLEKERSGARNRKPKKNRHTYGSNVEV